MSEDSDSDSLAVGRVAESINRVGGKRRCRSAQVVIRSDELIVDKLVDFLIDSGVYSTVMSETNWKKAGKFKLGECKRSSQLIIAALI